MLNSAKCNSRQQGFTLIELIIVIVITGIIAVGSTQFIVNSVQGLQDISRRSSLANQLTVSVDKIQQQVQMSAIDSIRVRRGSSGQCVEMLPIQASAFYTEAPIGRISSKLETLSLQKKVLGMRAYIAGDSSQDLYSQLGADQGSALSAIITAQQDSPQSAISRLTFARDQRFLAGNSQQIVHFVKQPLSYCIEGSALYRYSRYPLKKTQPLPANLPQREPHKVLVSNSLLAASAFSFNRAQLRLGILLSAGDKHESLTINQQLKLSYE